MSATAALLAGHPDDWAAATTGDFLAGVGDGSLPTAAFDRWLEQDHLFVQQLVRAWGLVLQQAPPADFALLVGGLAAFQAELEWFEEIAAARDLDLSAQPLPEAADYHEALLQLAAEPYPVAISAMWAVEEAYLQAWRGVAPGAQPYREFVSHWSGTDFEAFVASLRAVVDGQLPVGPTDAATAAVLEVAHHEAAFWRMTVAGT